MSLPFKKNILAFIKAIKGETNARNILMGKKVKYSKMENK